MEKKLYGIGIQNFLVPCFVAATLLVALITLPSSIMDLLLSVNLAFGVIILLTTFFVRKPLDFSIFPTVLLITTLFRLVLNIATTRLILTRAGEYGDLAAGHVIKSFSGFVSGESLVVGIVIFSLFIIVQFVVITKGATRISEVAARFTLDAMPGRQMAIDADLRAGEITDKQARILREELTEQSDFFGAMDGASKFVRGDAIASLIITFINVIGGLFVGVIQDKMPLSDALTLYTTLTIGDGLVSQIPALLISIATGILITRSRESKDLPSLVLAQLFFRPEVLLITALFLCILALTGMPPVPLLAIGLCCFVFSFVLKNKKKNWDKEAESSKEKGDLDPSEKKGPERIENYLAIDPMELELGIGLLAIADPDQGGDILDRIRRIRERIASELGLLLPKVRIRDSLLLDDNQYRIRIDGEEVGFGMIYPMMYLAVQEAGSREKLDGLQTTSPIDGQPAYWIEEKQIEKAKAAGYDVLDPKTIIEQHLFKIIQREAGHFLTRDAAKHLLDELHSISPAVVDELIPDQLSIVQVQQILRLLLDENVSIRQLGTILETVGDFIARTQDPVLLAEQVRQRLARTLCGKLRDPDRFLHVLLCSPEWEQIVQDGITSSDQGWETRLDPIMVKGFLKNLGLGLAGMKAMRFPPVLLVSPGIRFAVRNLTRPEYPDLNVLSFKEISSDTKTISEGTISSEMEEEGKSS
ncbi:MAG: flagellar biosynthesis protein FlhA [Planctomycetia bacterium]|nr:flagellar biosynthesis protein FlhA [Planctomycetia bacterium]